VADICKRKQRIFLFQTSLYLYLCLGCIYFFSRNVGIFLFFFIFFCLSFKYPFCALLDFLFMYSCFILFVLCFLSSFCSNYLDDVAQFNSKGLISSSLSSFPTTITDHVLLSLFFFLSYFQNKQL
jgi:hypothetical protein